ncbi:MAG: DUF1116 domain-containing protein [Lachnospiraceae bacterium]|nr:DUF1116 domain-containing protein [Lachnospiraceae bacterium]
MEFSDSLLRKMGAANEAAADVLINADPVWEDIRPAGEVLTGMDDYTVTHSGPPIAYEDMVALHRRGMVSACLFEGWAKTEEEAVKLIESGKIRIRAALDLNTSGSGTGIITKSVAVLVVRDRNNGKTAAVFPAEGPVYQGGFAGWGLYSEGIAENMKKMREYLLPPIAEALRNIGGLPLKEMIAESLTMGDENHSRQTAADLFMKQALILPILKTRFSSEQIYDSLSYLLGTPRFFHALGQSASRAAALGNVGRPYSTVLTAACGNGVEYGIKIAALGDRWFTAPSPMMQGKYLDDRFTIEDQIPWCGDSSVTEVAGLGGIAGAASPIVCAFRGMKLKDAIAQTEEMAKITVKRNPYYPVPNLDGACLPVAIDAKKVAETGILPILHGGMFNKEGGLLGPGAARIPLQCFQKAMDAYRKAYPNE